MRRTDPRGGRPPASGHGDVVTSVTVSSVPDLTTLLLIAIAAFQRRRFAKSSYIATRLVSLVPVAHASSHEARKEAERPEEVRLPSDNRLR